MLDTNWMKLRLEKLSKLRTELIERGFASEIITVHDGVEEFLVKEIKGKLYVCSIHHTFVDWYFSEKTSKFTFPMYEDHFFKTIRDEDQPKCQNCGHQPIGTHVYLKQDSEFVYWICRKCGATIKVNKP